MSKRLRNKLRSNTLATLALSLLGGLLMANGDRASAAILAPDGSAITGLEVTGVGVFDVEFVDGSCFDLFNDCNEDSDFPFATNAEAIATAILNVIGDQDPTVLVGCNLEGFCETRIPIGLWEGDVLRYVAIVNAREGGDIEDSAHIASRNNSFTRFSDLSGFSGRNFARVSEATPDTVPEPGTLIMSGIAALVGGVAKRKFNEKSKGF